MTNASWGSSKGLRAMVDALVSWPTFLIALVVFGFAPRAVLRVILLAYPSSDPRRRELHAELHAVPRLERPIWVLEQLEVALFEGIPRRIKRATGVVPQLLHVSEHRRDIVALAANVVLVLISLLSIYGAALAAVDPRDRLIMGLDLTTIFSVVSLSTIVCLGCVGVCGVIAITRRLRAAVDS